MHAFPQYLKKLKARLVADGDQEFMRQLYASTRDDLRMMPADAAFIASLIAMQQQMQSIGYRNAYPQAQYWVLEHMAQPAGRVVINASSTNVRVVDIAFMPEARGLGFGTEVLSALQKIAEQQSTPLILSVHKNNQRARRLYAALGFVSIGEDELSEQLQWSGKARH